MSPFRISSAQIKLELLNLFAGQPVIPGLGLHHVNRFSLIGKALSPPSPLDRALGVNLSVEEKGLAYRCLEELERFGLVIPSLMDLSHPRDWLTLSESGIRAQEMGAIDELDVRLAKLNPALVERRHGALAAVYSGSADAGPQAAQSARELLRQTLDGIVPRAGLTLKQQIEKVLMASGSRRESSESEAKLLEALIALLYARLSAIAKAEETVNIEEAAALVRDTERVLQAILVPE